MTATGPRGAPLLLIAASGLAREVLALLRTHRSREVLGILDDAVELHGGQVDGISVLGGLDDVAGHPDAELVVCAGRGEVRELLVGRLLRAGVAPERFATVVHPGIEVPAGSSIGAGSIVLAGVVLTTAVMVGRHVVVMPNVTLTHDDRVDDFATLCAGVALGGSVVVGKGAYLGMNASVRERTAIGSGATLGMGAALLTDLPAGQTWGGVPARRLAGPAGPRGSAGLLVGTTP